MLSGGSLKRVPSVRGEGHALLLAIKLGLNTHHGIVEFLIRRRNLRWKG
jgi:hypothetical protein